MFSSIRIRLTLSYLAVIALAMGLSGFLLLSSLERYFLEAAEQSLITQAQITAQALIPGAVAAGPPPDLAPAYNAAQQQSSGRLYLQAENVIPPPPAPAAEGANLGYLAQASLQLSTQLETRIRILDNQGVVLVDSRQEEQGANLSGHPLVAQALAGQQASQVEEAGRESVMSVALPALVNGERVGVVYLSQPLRDVTAVLYDLRRQWLFATAVAVLLSGGAGLLLSRAIARPLAALTRAAGAVAEGKFDLELPARSHDELGRLSRAFNDMTARLRAARQMQVGFVANVSHELRTPLTTVKGMLETLRDGAVDDLEVRDRFLETVENETDRLIRLVNDLLILSRADSEALNLRRQPLDLALLAGGVVERLATQTNGDRKLLLHAEVAPPAWADPDRVEQVLLNLLDNALKYSRPGGAVTVRITATQKNDAQGDGMVVVQVRDEGSGIPAAELPRIGERFYRADRARSRAEGGSGLGVAIARALVEAHGGRLWLESREGQGTVATFTLPTA
jgi:signal transduction histidine kinase